MKMVNRNEKEMIKRMLKEKKGIIYLLSFFIPVCILLLNYIYLGIYPFGENTILKGDEFSQYILYYNYLYDFFHGNTNLFYSFESGLGMNFFAIFAYYLSSPFSLVILFFSRNGLPESLALITLLKIGTAGLTMCLYIVKNKYLSYAESLIFSTIYSLLTFSIAYSFNIMWLDAIYLLPLVLLGTDKLFTEKNNLLIISLVILFMSNFYMAYIVGAFAFLYFVMKLIIYKEKKTKLLFLFFFSVILAIGISAVIIVPTFFAIKGNSYDTFEMNNFFKLILSNSEFLTSLYKGTTDIFTTPNIFPSSLVLLVAPFFYFSPEVNKSEKISISFILLLLIFSVRVEGGNLIWHAFQAPTGYLQRFSFLISFVLIYMAIRSFRFLKDVHYVYLFISYGLNVLVISILWRTEYMSLKSFQMNLIFLTLVGIVLMVAINLKNKYSLVMILVVCSIDLYTNNKTIFIKMNENPGYNYTRENLYLNNKNMEKEIMDLKEKDTSFYRANVLDKVTLNDSFRLNYKGMSNFNSLGNSVLNKSLNNLGYSTTLGLRTTAQNEGILPTDNLFGFKYLVSTSPFEKLGYERIESKNNVYLYQNKNYLPVGFMVKNKNEKMNSDNFFENQNSLLRNFGMDFDIFQVETPRYVEYVNLSSRKIGATEIVTKINPNEDGFLKYTFSNLENKELYNYIDTGKGFDGFGDFSLKTDQYNFFDYPTFHKEGIQDLGYNKDKSEMIVTLTPQKNETQIVRQSFYSVSEKNITEVSKQFQKEVLTKIKYKGNKLSGTVSSDSQGMLFLSIPFDKGWQLKVNNKKETIVNKNGFIGINLNSGDYQIKLVYIPKGFYLGLIISTSTLILFSILNIMKYKKVNRKDTLF